MARRNLIEWTGTVVRSKAPHRKGGAIRVWIGTEAGHLWARSILAVVVVTATTAPATGAWLTERRSGIGGSDIAGIAGISPWASPWSVWASKVGLAADSAPDEWTPSMRLGTDLEPVIGEWFTRETGLTVAGEQTLVRHRRIAHHFATVDGFVLDSPTTTSLSALGVFEAKYTADAWDELPDHYVAQVQWQLHCTGLAGGLGGDAADSPSGGHGS